MKRHLILTTVSYLFLTKACQRLRGKNREWTVCQVRVATDALVQSWQLEPRARERLYDRTAKRIQYHQRRNAFARSCHTRTTIRKLHRNGIKLTDLPRATKTRVSAVVLIGPAINQNNNAGIWEGTISSFNLVAREGQQAPGTAAGVLFNTATGASTCFTDPLVSALGETVFTSTLTGPGVTNLNNEGLWATDPNGDLSLIMRLGDQINLGALGIKTITAIGYVNDTTAWGSNTDGLNDLGQISVQLQFNDATEALVLVQLPVPEPATWLLVGLGGICIWFSPAVSKAADLRRKRSRSQRTMIA